MARFGAYRGSRFASGLIFLGFFREGRFMPINMPARF